ncbi:MAG: spore cortex biosynthesis protein YabQ [Bacillota bacterium]|nr:spore cortex biosynthesis protein YabQ [Bacillota bacterium]
MTGFLAGVIYCVLRAVKKEFKLKKSVPVIDISFWVVVLFLYYSVLYKSGEGQMRGFVLLGGFCGSALYFLCFDKKIRKFVEGAVHIICVIIDKIFMPFRKIREVFCNILKKLVKIVHNKQKKGRKFVKKILEKAPGNGVI